MYPVLEVSDLLYCIRATWLNETECHSLERFYLYVECMRCIRTSARYIRKVWFKDSGGAKCKKSGSKNLQYPRLCDCKAIPFTFQECFSNSLNMIPCRWLRCIPEWQVPTLAMSKGFNNQPTTSLPSIRNELLPNVCGNKKNRLPARLLPMSVHDLPSSIIGCLACNRIFFYANIGN